MFRPVPMTGRLFPVPVTGCLCHVPATRCVCALEMAARTRSNSFGSARALEIAWPGCSKTLHLPTCASSSPLGSAGALDIGARARSAPLGRPKSPTEPAWLRWTGDASLGRTTNACCAQHRDEHYRAWNVQVRINIYIYIYVYIQEASFLRKQQGFLIIRLPPLGSSKAFFRGAGRATKDLVVEKLLEWFAGGFIRKIKRRIQQTLTGATSKESEPNTNIRSTKKKPYIDYKFFGKPHRLKRDEHC